MDVLRFRKSAMAVGAVAIAGLWSAAPQAQVASAAPAARSQADEIVVTARRSGIPVWRVSGSAGTVVLVGAIRGVAKDTRWDPAPLARAVVSADKVMFPDTVQVSVGAFSAIGLVMRWRKHATLPKGQTLAQLMPPEQFARLVALKNRGVLKAGFERKHPFHLAMTLQGQAKGKRGHGPAADEFVRRTVKKHKIKLVPLETRKAKPLAEDLFTSRPESHVPCLLKSMALAEAGPAAVKARSDAWAERRVPDVLNSPAQDVYRFCWPAGTAVDRAVDAKVVPTVRRLLAEPAVTVAVLSLDTLAQNGGVLDDLKAAGFDVRGPRWR